MFVESEGDQIASDAEQFRLAADVSEYRVYEIAGAAHEPSPPNPLDHLMVMRAMFVAGDRWVRAGIEPPPSTLLEQAPPGEIDPVYDYESGIARDEDRNARGGIRLPDLHVGRAQFIAADFSVGELPGLAGGSIDLACEPRPGASDDEPRFKNHGAYVSAFVQQVNRLREDGFLLPADAEILEEGAAASAVGKPQSC